MIAHCRVDSVSLSVSPEALPWETEHRAEIDAHWARARAEKPGLFDGQVFFAGPPRIDRGGFRAVCQAGRYATLQYWKSLGKPEIGVCNIYGAVALCASDGAVLMGEMAPHTANAGRIYFPGGAFDPSDQVGATLDADANLLREACEETGLPAATFCLRAGYHVLHDPSEIVIARIADLPWDARTSRARILESMASTGDAEFQDIHIATSSAEIDALQPSPYARTLSKWIFDHD